MARKYSKRSKEEYQGYRANFQHFIVKFFLKPYYVLFFKLKVNGIENVPQNERIIVAANHQSHFDPPLLSSALNRPVAYMAKEELFKVPLLAQWIDLLGAFAVNRNKLEVSTIKTAKNVMSTDWVLGMFPEGTRVRNLDKVGKIHKGFTNIARMTKAKVLPVGITYDRPLCPFFGKVVVNIGKPIDLPENPEDLVGLWGTAISELTGREYLKEQIKDEVKDTAEA